MNTRRFSGSDEFLPPERNVEGAPDRMRVEFVDIPFALAERAGDMNNEPTPQDVYLIAVQVLGIVNPAAQPNNGFRLRTQQYLLEAEWPRFYDVVLRLRDEFGLGDQRRYENSVNTLLAAHGIVWQMTQTGRLERVLPAPLAEGVRATIDELRRPGYEAARQLFDAAMDAFNAIPRRDRDAATNAFDAMESAAKVRLNMPAATFGDALNAARRLNRINNEVHQVLDRVNTLRHRHLGHGMAQPFNLSPNEVDFVYVTCAAGVRLFARL